MAKIGKFEKRKLQNPKECLKKGGHVLAHIQTWGPDVVEIMGHPIQTGDCIFCGSEIAIDSPDVKDILWDVD